MPRPPSPYYSRGAWRSDFGGVKNRILVRGEKNEDTELQAEEELLRLRKEDRLVHLNPSVNTPFAVVVERFLAKYVGRPAYHDFRNELHWFMGLEPDADPDHPVKRAGKNAVHGGRFGVPCKSWPIRRITSAVVEDYLRRRNQAGLRGYHAFVALRTLMNWAVKKKYIPSHQLDEIDMDLRRQGRRHYLPSDADVVRIFNAAEGKFKEILLIYMTTGIRPGEVCTVRTDEFDAEKRQWVLWRHKTVYRTGKPKVVPLGTEAAYQLCLASARDRAGDEMLFVNSQKDPWTYNALRLRWYRLRNKLGLDSRFTLYSLRHWYVTVALESGESEALVGELAGHVDRATIDFYKKLRNASVHQAASRVADHIAHAGIGVSLPPTKT